MTIAVSFLQLQRTSFAARRSVLPVTLLIDDARPTDLLISSDFSMDPLPTKIFVSCPIWCKIGIIVSNISGALGDPPGCISTDDALNKPWNLVRP